MHSASRPKTLTGSVTAHVTEGEERTIRERAEALGLTKSEWCRQVILKALDTDQETRLILSKILALRKIVLALQIDLIQDREPSEQRIRSIIEQADATKSALVDQRVLSAGYRQ